MKTIKEGLKNTSVILDLMTGTVSMETDDSCLSFRDKVLSSQTFFFISWTLAICVNFELVSNPSADGRSLAFFCNIQLTSC